jgi:hypothetical protein
MPDSGSSGRLTAGIVYFSSAQAPRSICLHRFEQKGRNGLASLHVTLVPQVGQSTMVAMVLNNELKIAKGEVKRDIAVKGLRLHVAALRHVAYP